ncbi:hypothetical protein ACFX12_041037 [Malus domestica]
MLQPQIVQSPARLGLANPTSPSLPNPTPPNVPSQPQPNLSPTLVSLLPPLPRAQSLLVQMASLASKLFQSLPPTALESSPSSTKEMLSQFTALQTQLFEAELQEILHLQDAKLKIACEVKSKDAALLSFYKILRDVEQNLGLDKLLFVGYSHLPHRTSKCALLSFEGKEETMQAMLEPTPPEPTNQLPNLGALQGLLPPNITVPSGWKPGMPVELPTEFPVPPPGWKPGDPVPLPVPRVEDQQLRPNAHPAVHKPPATIQVQHVELDILDPDDDSDYSTEDGSSDDDE